MGLLKKKADRKKFKDTTVGKFLKEKAPHILDAIGDRFPAVGLVRDLISKDDKMSAEDKETAMKMAEFELKEMEEVTQRWQSDMNSDSWLSKNVRPLVLLYLLFLLTLVVVLSFWKIEIPKEYTALLSTLMVTTFLAYFGGRTMEKYNKN